MKKLLLLILALSFNAVFSQGIQIVKYYSIAKTVSAEGVEQSWFLNYSKIVINHNNVQGDIRIISGKDVYDFKQLGDASVVRMSGNKDYAQFKVIDSVGATAYLQIFNEDILGARFIFPDMTSIKFN